MIFCKKKTMMAVELKYFQHKGKGLNHSFYEGIEQALALLRWGFDYVVFWQLFEWSTSAEELWFYGGWTWNFLLVSPDLGELGLPLEFTFMRRGKANQGYDFYPIQPDWTNGSMRLKALPLLYDPEFKITTPHKNTLELS